MRASFHPQTTQSPVRPRIEPWARNAGHTNLKTLLHLRWAVFKRWAGAFSYRLDTNRYVFYGSLILAASLIAGAVTRGQETLWRSAAALGIATVVIGLVHAVLDARSAREGSGQHRKRRAKPL